MQQDKLISLFRDELVRCKLEPGESVIVLSGEQSPPEYIQAALLAARELGGQVFQMNLLAPQKAPGAGDLSTVGVTAVTGQQLALETLKQADLIIDLLLLLHSPEQVEILNAGTRKEYRGWGDTRTAARDRAARKAGVTPAQAERLWKNWQTMKHPNGDVYRLLRNAYENLCLHVENTAGRMERRRLERTGNAAFKSAVSAGEGNHPRRRADDMEDHLK